MNKVNNNTRRRRMSRPRAYSAMWALVVLIYAACGHAADRELVVIDQDGSGPGGSNQRSIMALLQAPRVQVLGISMVTGNAWMTDETAHTLRMLELVGRRDVPVYRGATYPLVRSKNRTLAMQRFDGRSAWLGAYGHGKTGNGGQPGAVGEMPEGKPTIKADRLSAARFLVRAVRRHPGQVTVWAAGPLTNLALAQRMDPGFARLARQLVIMGGSISPETDNAEFSTRPNHEFNFWFDPEAAHIVLNAPWKQITDTSVDISLKATFTDRMMNQLKDSSGPAAQYLVKYDQERYFMWDEIAALGWLYPELITQHKRLYLDTDLSRGPNYGNTVAWDEQQKPAVTGPPVDVQLDLNVKRFKQRFIELMQAPTPQAERPAISQ